MRTKTELTTGAKFELYWKSIGKPKIEADFKIANDPNWVLRKRWVESNYELPLEVKHGIGDWMPATYMLPPTSKETVYRERI